MLSPRRRPCASCRSMNHERLGQRTAPAALPRDHVPDQWQLPTAGGRVGQRLCELCRRNEIRRVCLFPLRKCTRAASNITRQIIVVRLPGAAIVEVDPEDYSRVGNSYPALIMNATTGTWTLRRLVHHQWRMSYDCTQYSSPLHSRRHCSLLPCKTAALPATT